MLWLACFLVFPAQQAAAQPVDAARSASARALFEEGVRHADQGEWREAASSFERALALRGSQVIRYNLAAALSELGRVVEASELLQGVLRDPAIDAELRGDAQAKLGKITAQIARLTVELDPPARSVRVELDRQNLDAALIGVPVPMDPGEHHLSVFRGSSEVDQRTLQLAPGEVQTVTLHTANVATPREAAQTVVADSSFDATAASHADDKRKRRLWWGLGAGAAAVVGIVTVSVLLAGGSGGSDKGATEGDFDPPSIPVKVGP